MHLVICRGRREEVKEGVVYVYMFIWCMCVGGE